MQSIYNLRIKAGPVEIFSNHDLILFGLSRFIDNGYGIALIFEDKLEKIRKEERYKINGLEITSIVKIKEDWYYISFT